MTTLPQHAIPVVRKDGAKNYQVVEEVKPGQLVEGRQGTKPGVAAAGSLRVLGVCTNHAVPEVVTTPVNGVLDMAPLGDRAHVEHAVEVRVTYAAQAVLGDKLVAASLGRVTPAGANPDPRTIVAECTEPDGVAAGATGLAWIY